jgi:hypothetical protein
MFKRIKVEKMKYKNDSISYALVLLSLVVNILYFANLYKNNAQFYYTIEMGMSVLYNLIFMLGVFMCAEFIKKYNRNYAIATFVLGIMQIVRIFNYPLDALKEGALSQGNYNQLVIFLVISGALLIAGSVISFVNSTLLKEYVAGRLKVKEEE